MSEKEYTSWQYQYKHATIQAAVRAASARIVQQSGKLGAVAVERIIWEEIDKRLEAKP